MTGAGTGLLVFVIFFVLGFRGIVPAYIPQLILYVLIASCFMGLLRLGLQDKLAKRKINLLIFISLLAGLITFVMFLIFAKNLEWYEGLMPSQCAITIMALIFIMASRNKRTEKCCDDDRMHTDQDN